MENPYDLEVQRVLDSVAQHQPKTMVLQFADGLKPFAKDVTDAIHEEHPDVRVLIWGGSDFGGCDLPIGLDRLKVDLLVAFGHAPWVWGDELRRYRK